MNGDSRFHLLRIELDAERMAGAWLEGMPLKNGDPSNNELPGLTDLGVTKMESSRWQALAAIPDEQYQPQPPQNCRKSTTATIEVVSSAAPT